ncbi:MAG: hypothetical protein ACXVSX_12000 [Solirubrobacteraceae bacterium]
MSARLGRALPALRLAGFAVAVAVVAVMGVQAVRDLPEHNLTWWPLAGALLAAAVWWLLLGWGWGILADGRATRAQLGLWCRTQVMRYLPGGIWAPVSRAAVIEGRALDRISTVAAENATALCAALAVGGIALAVGRQAIWLALALVVIVPVAAARVMASRTRLAPDRALRATGTYLLGFVAYAIAAVLVQAAISGWHAPAQVAGAVAIAWSAGLVVVIAPSGIGVREVAYVALLGGVLPRADLTAGAVTMRAVTIAAELGALLIAGRPPTLSRKAPTERATTR